MRMSIFGMIERKPWKIKLRLLKFTCLRRHRFPDIRDNDFKTVMKKQLQVYHANVSNNRVERTEIG